MSRRLSCCVLALLILAITDADARQPNIVLLVTDDLGYGELSCQGNPEIPTPHIDSIAKNGVRFTSGYVSAPVCSPSRAGLMTGRYQTRFGHEFNRTGKGNLDPAFGLPLSERTLADRLRDAGYATGLVGKWHLGSQPKSHPQQRGFDEFFGFLHEGHYYAAPPFKGVSSFLRTNELPVAAKGRQQIGDVTWSTAPLHHNEPHYDEDNPLFRGTNIVDEKEFLTDALTREANSFIVRHKDRPFFLYLAYNAVHSPMQASHKYLSRFEKISDIHRRIFAAMLANLDDSVGSVLDKIRALNLEKDTLIFFLSDNGGPTDELTSSNKPLRGEKGQLWEGGIRIPFMMLWKGQVPAGQIFDRPVISQDIFFTSIFAGQAKLPDDRPMDGVNLIAHVTGENPNAPHDILFWRYGSSLAVRKGNWKLVKQAANRGTRADFELFNLANDIGETRNLAKENAAIFTDLQSALQKFDKQMVPPLWPAGFNNPKQ